MFGKYVHLVRRNILRFLLKYHLLQIKSRGSQQNICIKYIDVAKLPSDCNFLYTSTHLNNWNAQVISIPCQVKPPPPFPTISVYSPNQPSCPWMPSSRCSSRCKERRGWNAEIRGCNREGEGLIALITEHIVDPRHCKCKVEIKWAMRRRQWRAFKKNILSRRVCL